MDEMNVAQPEVTEVETETTTDNTVTEEETQVDTVSDDEVQDNTTETEAVDGEQEDAVEDIFSLDVKYNKQNRSLNREDATRYAQMGLKFESMQPTLKKLQYLAAADGKSLESLVDDIVNGIENSKLEKFKAKADGDEEILNALIEVDKRKVGKAYDEWQEAERKAEEKEQEDEIKTLAKEFSECQKQLPELANSKFEDVPDEVLRLRDSENITLFDAYLRFKHFEIKAQTKELNKQKANAESSTGSAISSVGASDDSTLPKDLLKSIWGN